MLPNLSEMVARFLLFYQSHIAVDTCPHVDVPETLEILQASGYHFGVCTNKPTDLSIALLETINLRNFFSAVIDGDSVPK
jgi:phosphoglycolate phosphatase